MHEYSIIQSLIGRVSSEARRHRASSIHRLHVSIGSLSGVDPHLLETAFEVFREAVPAFRSTELTIRDVETKWGCPFCGNPIVPGSVLRCPDCQRPARLLQGDEIILERIEMEVP